MCVLVSLHPQTQMSTSVSGKNMTASRARIVLTRWVPSPVSVRMVTARLAQSALVRSSEFIL